MTKYLIPCVFLLVGCSGMGRNIHVLSSHDVIKDQQFTLYDGDSVACDPTGCKVVTK